MCRPDRRCARLDISECADMNSMGYRRESIIDTLLPVGLLAGLAYVGYKLFIADDGNRGVGIGENLLDELARLLKSKIYRPGVVSTPVGEVQNGIVVAPTDFARRLVDMFAGAGTFEPENVMGGASWTRYAVPAALPNWAPPGLVAMVSGRDQPIAGQVAFYNPTTGNAWGGVVDTMKYLYTAGLGSVCDIAALNACRNVQCTNDITAACWRQNYG